MIDLQSKRVLVVEDDYILAQSISRDLRAVARL